MTNTQENQAWSRRDILGLVGFVAVCGLVSVLGGLAAGTSVGTWYLTLDKPPFNPPGWIFGPVWAVLYLFIAIAGWRVWHGAHGEAGRRALTIYGVQLLFNLAWSFLFFGFRRIDLALVEILVLLAVIITNMMLFWRLDRWAGMLFVPYVLWVGFASLLNASIWWLN